jgi:hypothetical protein
VLASADGRGDGERMVSISSVSPEVNAPVVTEWIEETVDTPPVMLVPTIAAEAGVRSWHATVMYNGRSIGMLRSDGSEPEGTIDAGMVLRDFESGGAMSALSAELIVEDSTGALAIARDTLPVRLDSAVLGPGALADRTITRHVITGITGVPAKETDRTIAAIVAGIHGQARIEVSRSAWGGGAIADTDAPAHLAYVGDRLRNTCAQEGKHITAFDLRNDVAPLNDASPAFPAPRELAAPILVTVIEGR